MSDCDMKNFKERPVIHAPEAESVFVNMVSQDYADIETLYKTTSHILRLMCLFMEYNAVERKTNHSRNMHLTHYTLAYIRANYSKECSLLDIANNLHIDRNYLTKIFKQETGFTPKQYLKACRVYYGALMMLKHPGATVTNISDEIGYSDVSNFRKAFETNLKVSVSYYRRLSDKDKIKCVSEFCREYAFPNPSVT